MRRDPDEIEGVTLPQVFSDPVLKRNQKLYHSLVRDLKSRGVLSATLSPLEHVGMFLCTNPTVDCVLSWTRDVRTPIFYLLLVCDCRRLRDSDESKSPCPKVLMWNLRKGLML